jgi:membrane protein implicated in regulation of membrane protease activity
VWLCTVVVGMLLRKATSAGVAASFVVVATSVTALLLLGWRAVARLTRRAERSTRRA